MQILSSPNDILDVLPLIGTVCQMCTAVIAVAVGVVTFRYTKRQSALTLVNHNNALADAVNGMVVASAEARSVLGKCRTRSSIRQIGRCAMVETPVRPEPGERVVHRVTLV